MDANDATSEVHFGSGQDLRVKGDPASVAAIVWPPNRGTSIAAKLERATGGEVYLNPAQVLYVSPAGSSRMARD